MRVIEAGHIYELECLDSRGEFRVVPQQLKFVNREAGSEHDGTQTQEVLRATIELMDCLIDRTNHCDDCLRWEGNDKIVKALSEAQRNMRLAILYHEQRVLERKFEKGTLSPEKVPVARDGHYKIGDLNGI